MDSNGKATWNLHIKNLSLIFFFSINYNKTNVVKQGVTTTERVPLTLKNRAIINSILLYLKISN
ncbi:MAG TPA: hypothetical protein DEO31_04105 [Streptococcus sp.]|nr:hypothetical protein [Streptococcus thermophilus]HBY91592.1 hypothetical protein [Streptococcus sp.]MCT2939424.1 hypothetical protein [Streptococcus thermophilus]MCT2947128.1 hypothetical protein [Streptococcus thermophilus]MCT2952105.1 hypothetical protein [Streptococcus thermophilus]